MLLTNNPNAPEKYGRTPINEAVRVIGHLNIVKILVNLTENPNAPGILGRKPIYKASFVTILAPLTDNPNAHYKNNFIGLKQKLISNST